MITLLGMPSRSDSELLELTRNNDGGGMRGIKKITKKNNYHKLPIQQTLTIQITMQFYKR